MILLFLLFISTTLAHNAADRLSELEFRSFFNALPRTSSPHNQSAHNQNGYEHTEPEFIKIFHEEPNHLSQWSCLYFGPSKNRDHYKSIKFTLSMNAKAMARIEFIIHKHPNGGPGNVSFTADIPLTNTQREKKFPTCEKALNFYKNSLSIFSDECPMVYRIESLQKDKEDLNEFTSLLNQIRKCKAGKAGFSKNFFNCMKDKINKEIGLAL
jgi:hypothetical protein